MTLTDQVKQKGPWVALVSFLVLLTQFDKGLQLVSSKWNADALAGEAKHAAGKAQETANGVDSRFERYLLDQEKQRDVEQARIEEQAKYNQRLLELQEQQMTQQRQPQRPNQAASVQRSLEYWQDADGLWWACNPSTDCRLGENWWRE